MLGMMMTLARFARRAVFLAPALAAFAFAAPARANGRFPASGQIALDPSDPDTLLVEATYGLLLTHDGGKNWGWICEPAVGYGNVEDPVMAFMSNGTLLAGIFEGLSLGTPDGCQWGFADGGLSSRYVIDLSVDKVTPSNALLIISNNAGQDDAGDAIYLTQLWQTSDDGATWTQAGVNLPQQYLGLTVDAAPSNPMRVYSSGRNGPPDYPGVLERTDDRGATWLTLPIPGSDNTNLPYISAVDPTNPDVVYVRLDAQSTGTGTATSDTLIVSKDGGMTWSTAYTALGALNGFALSPDGTTVAIGGPMDGVLTAPSSTLAFTKVSSVGALCLSWDTTALYACASEFTDGFTAGISSDQGKTWTPIFHLSDFCQLQCAASTDVAQMCPAYWAPLVAQLDVPCGNGAGGATSSAASSSSSSSSGSGGSGGAAKSCACSLPGGADGMALSAAALSLLGLAALRVRRRR
jgi:photosystem II stability/assembly factor-like uncharacterized protein